MSTCTWDINLNDRDLLLLLRGGWILDADPDDFSVLADSTYREIMVNGYWLMAAAEKGVEMEPPEARGLL